MNATNLYDTEAGAKRAISRKFGARAAAKAEKLIKKVGKKYQVNERAAKLTGRPRPSKLNRSSAETPTQVVFKLADKMKDASRKEVLDACVDAGVSRNTAATYYQKWRVANGLAG